MNSDSIVACNVERLIDAKGLKKRSVAEKANLKPNQLSSLLHGRTRFNSDHILLLACALEVSPADLFASPPQA